MNTQAHLSIGEVLSLLQEEFPDVTISKIRFLESQGLVDPERTPSGYRKFYEADIDQLRWILTQQKENFLPLKVIKDRMAGREEDDEDAPPAKPCQARRPASGRVAESQRQRLRAGGATGLDGRCGDGGRGQRRAIRRSPVFVRRPCRCSDQLSPRRWPSARTCGQAVDGDL